MNWLPSVQFQDVHDKRSASLVTGTGIWFQTHELYQQWKASARSTVFWVKGKPGCGKSVLAALTLNELKGLQTDNTAVAHFYCDSSNPERSRYLYLLTTILKQISVQSPRLDHNLERMYNMESLVQDRGPGANEVEKILPAVFSGFRRAFMVIDGLDELSEPERFLRFLPLLLRETTSTLRVIVFSREISPMQNAFKDYPKLRVDGVNNAEDIKMFISSKLSADDPDWDPDLLDVVKAVLLDKAEGMFLYVSLMVGRLRGYLPQSELLERLKSLPKGLTKAYEANLKRILDQDDDLDKRLTLKILLWIANANRPLSRKELLEALSIRYGSKAIDRRNRYETDREFTTFCAELVLLNKDDSYHLVHASLREYLLGLRDDNTPELEDYRLMQLHAERTLAEACLTYLLFDRFAGGAVATAEQLTTLTRDNPFLQYAAENWGDHVALALEDAPIDLAWEFIDSENARNVAMQGIMIEENKYPFPGSSPLHMLAFFGLSKMANSRPQMEELKNQVDGFGLLPFDYAMLGRKRDMCLWLLENGEAGAGGTTSPSMARYSPFHVAVAFDWNDVLDRLISNRYYVDHISSNKQRTPLAEAAAQGNVWAVNRLLEAKADVNVKDADGKNPLMIALDEGHQEMVVPLLQNGTDIDAQDNDGVSAIHLAADTGNLAAVRILLQRKPLLQKTGESYWNQTPTHLAAEHDYDEIVKELHQYGADLEVQCKGGFRPIHVAAFHDSLKVAQLLGNLHAELNPLCEDDRTVLHIAAENSGIEFVQLILATTPDINAKENEALNTPLHSAASAGNTGVCKLLLEKGSTIDLPNKTNHTALHLAVLDGHLEIANLLLDHKFSPKKTAVFESPVLHYAANEGNKNMIAPLIGAEADPEAQNTHKHRALHFAARKGHVEFLEQLFTTVPDLEVDPQDTDGKTPLHLAAVAGHLETIRVLQARGAQQNVEDSSKNLPIHYAAWDGHVEVVEHFVSDANINTQGYNGRTPLIISALRGHENITRLLLARKARVELDDDDGTTPLMNAVQMNQVTIAKLLIENGANVHAKDNEHRTILHRAARNGDYDLVKLLLDRNCDARAVTKFGDTPFLDAVYSNNLKVVDLFAEREVDGSSDQNNLGTTCVHAAAEEGNLQMLVRLLNAGAKPDLIDRIGRSALLVAAMEGRHAVIQPLLSLGLAVDDPVGSQWTPLGTACEGGYLRFVEILLQNEANIHLVAKHTNMTPLHHAAAMHKPQIIRKLVDSGADMFSRDRYGNSAVDYARTHPALFKAIGTLAEQDDPRDLRARNVILATTIREELQCLLSIPTPLTVEDENVRLLTLAVLATSYLYLKAREYDHIVKFLYMELSFSADSAELRLNLDCDMCGISLNRFDLYVCRECHNRRLCTGCHENYTKGWKTPNRAPEAVRELERLETDIQPFREAMLPIIDDIRLQYVFFIFSFFTAVQTWADTKRKEYEAWESKHNSDDHYKARKRPGQQLLKLLDEGRLFMGSLEEKGLEFDGERDDCAAFVKKFSDYHRTTNIIRDYDAFDCAEHDYLHISKKEYDKVRLESQIFQPDRRLSGEWLRGLLNKFGPVDTASETQEERNRAAENDPQVSRTSTEREEASKGPSDGTEVAQTTAAKLNNPPDMATRDLIMPTSRTQDEKPATSEENPPSKDPSATNKAGETSTKSRPKMPQGLRSSFTQDFSQQPAARCNDRKPGVEEKPVLEELRSPTDAAAAFPNLKGATDEASAGRISNVKRFTAEELSRQHNLVRRITSPIVDAGDPFEELSPVRSATMPFFKFQGSQNTADIDRLREAKDRDAQAPTASDGTAVPNQIPPTQKPEASKDKVQETAEEVPPQAPPEERRVAVGISNTDNFGRLVMLALTVAEAVFPGFGDVFITRRLELGDLQDYSLQLEVERGGEEQRPE